ncbi:hypothetical protein XENOCAPTIV_011698, partial [Xenoophorus captivus]
NGLMGANELGMCHHNGERPVVHLGARVPMQPVEEERRLMTGVEGMRGKERRGLAWMVYNPLCPLLSPLASTTPLSQGELRTCLPAQAR